MKKASILFIIALIISVAGCKKNPEEKYHVMSLAQEARDYFATAKSGSYFVFQDTITGQIDTFKLTGYSELYAYLCYNKIDGKKVVAKQIDYIYMTTLTNETIRFSMTSDCDTANKVYLILDFGAAMGDINIIYSQNKFTNWVASSGLSCTYHPTYNIWGGQTYQDVYYFSQPPAFATCGFYADNDYVVAKGIGIVGYRCFDRYWTLIDKKIVL